jgi:hypothetical protein
MANRFIFIIVIAVLSEAQTAGVELQNNSIQFG